LIDEDLGSKKEGEGDKSLAYWKKKTHWEYSLGNSEFNREPRESYDCSVQEFEKVFE